MTEIGNKRIYMIEFKGKNYIHLREFYENNGEKLPGKKGITFKPEELDEVIAGLQKLKGEIDG